MKQGRVKIYTVLFIILCICIYLLFALFSIREPIMADQINFFNAAKLLDIGNVFFGKRTPLVSLDFPHPLLYVHLLSFIDKFWGINTVNARLIGILCFIITLLFIYFISKKIFEYDNNGRLIALLACFLYSINPMVIQGSLLIDIDNTILTVALLFFIFYFVRFSERLNFKNLFLLGLLFALSLWTKLTTPLILILSIIMFHFLNGTYKKGLLQAFVILTIGVTLFLFTWRLYCYVYSQPFFAPFGSLWGSFFRLRARGTISHQFITLFRTSVRIIL